MSRAFTLVELLIVLAILAVVGAIGWGTMRDDLPRFRLVQTAKALRADLMQLQSLAVQRSRETRLRLVESGGTCTDTSRWGGRWVLEVGDRSSGSTRWDILPEDSSADASDDDTTEGMVDIGPDGNRKARFVCLEPWSSIGGPGSGNADSIVFSPSAWVTNPSTDFDAAGAIELTLVNEVAREQGVVDEISIRVARSGFVRLESTLGSSSAASASAAPTSSAP
jgi:prepilin-type N-terminal cleavage/methylation domain-containing protein